MRARQHLNIVHLKDRKNTRRLKVAIDGSADTPLVCLRRDAPGPRGESIGAYTANPKEVDAIACRAWNRIYQGSTASKDDTVCNFIKEHVEAVFTNKEFDVDDITGRPSGQNAPGILRED